jgi:hypothetical protein
MTNKSKKKREMAPASYSRNTSSTSRIQIKEEVKQPSGIPVGEGASRRDLPKGYGETKLVLLPRDPYWMFAYWEISPQDWLKIKSEYGEDIHEKSRLILRVYDVTSVKEKFDGKNADRYFDIYITEVADNWYINVDLPNRSYCVDIGLLTNDNRFIMLARSNIVHMPREGISPITDEQWAVLQKEFEQILQLAGVESIGKGSLEIAKLVAERWKELVSVSPLFSRMVAPWSISSMARVVPLQEERARGFWLKADTELIIYGTTEPTAKLFILGNEYRVNPDGSFSLRIALTEGIHDIPIKAISEDGSMEKEIIFKIERKTVQAK